MAKLLKTKISLVHKILLMVFGILITFTVAVSLQFHYVTNMMNENTKANFNQYARIIGDNVADQFYERYGDVQAFAQNKMFREKSNPADLVQLLNQYVQLYGIYDLIVYTDINGKVIAVNNQSYDSKSVDTKRIYETNLSKTNWFKNALQGNWTEDTEKHFTGTFFEDVQIDNLASVAYSEKRYTTVFASTVKDSQGKIVGILSNHANLLWVESQIKDFYKDLNLLNLDEIEITLINKKGQVIVDYDPTTNNKNLNFSHDSNVLLKLNLIEKNIESARLVTQGQSGALIEKHARKGIDQIVGFSAIRSDKFISDINWGVLVRLEKTAAMGFASSAIKLFFISLSAFLVLTFFVTVVWSKRIGKSFLSVSDELNKSIEHTSAISTSLSQSSKDLAFSAENQATAIQESVSALNEMSSMINQTTQIVQVAMETAEQVTSQTIEGQKVMQQMTQAMVAIQQANSQLQGLSKIISDISSKTNIINDIVFKTQLLSFNASIEAARAGQHGRGFAVVAEEVGNLAQMSGNAAREIETLLSESQHSVSDTLRTIQGKISEGNTISAEALDSFNKISTRIGEITEQVKSVIEATQQQELGIQQTTEAMKQIDISAQSTQQSSQKAYQTAEELNNESKMLWQEMTYLKTLVTGGNKTPGSNHNMIATSNAISAEALALQQAAAAANAPVNDLADITADDDLFKRVS
jgi:hypothetical protein